MWARLQGVGISVRADTALPWPLLLLHKASQPALSPGLESVSAATCQIKNQKGGKKTTLSLPSYPYVTNHSSPHLAPRSFASSLMIAAPVGSQSHHIICFFACLSYNPRMPFSLLPDLFQSNLSQVWFLSRKDRRCDAASPVCTVRD